MARADSTTTATKRPRKTAAEKAQADYDKARKAHEKAVERRDKVIGQIDAATEEVNETKRYLDFVSMNPALPPQSAAENVAEGEPAPAQELVNA